MKWQFNGKHIWRFGWGVGILCIVLSSCVERQVEISTSPSGAEVFVDGVFVGTTPTQFSFVHYGTRRIQIYHPKAQPLERRITLTPPLYEMFPIDLLVEVFWPFPIVDSHSFHFQLPPQTSPKGNPLVEERNLLKRALDFERKQKLWKR